MDTSQTIFMPSVQPSLYALSMQQQKQQQMQQVQQQQVAAVAQRLVQQQQQLQQQQQRTRPENPKLQTSLQKQQAQTIFNTSPSAAALNDFTLGQAAFTGNDYFSDIDYSPLTPKSSEPSFSPAELAADSDLDSWPNISLADNTDANDDFGFFAKTESATSPNFYNAAAANNTSFFPMQGRSLFETSAIDPLQLSKDGSFGAELAMNQQSQQPKQEIMDDEFGLFGSSPNMPSSMQQQQQQQQQSMETITIPRDARGAVRKTSSGSHSRIASDASSNGRKRKTMSMASSPESSTTPQSPPTENASSSKQGAPQSRKKTAHNVIEKRYRTNLNDKILALRDAVPALRITKDRKCKQSMPFSDEDEGGYDNGETAEELGGLLPAHKLNKATILGKATEYICHLEKQNDYLERYIVSLECTLRGLKDQGRQ